MSMTYVQYVGRLTDAIGVLHNNVHLPVLIPATIDHAEQRIYRTLDLLTTVTRDGTGAFTPSNRLFTFPQHFVVCQEINVITPPATAPDAGARNGLIPTTKNVLDFLWPSTTGAALPSSLAMLTDQTILVGPWPDQNYGVEVVGTIRPTPLSAANPTTFLTTYLPDLFLAASLVFAGQWMANFGQGSGTTSTFTELSNSWEQATGALMMSANTEELRKKWITGSWTSPSTQPSDQMTANAVTGA